ncbi:MULTISPECIES: Uma2 family endonuclease [Myxococcus]|nr:MULTISPECIES: Uma2 family endonuclease [Myxococcus]NOJ56448.1 Uma2 family endonuclease [Myxococcus xanthus]QPM80216.1 Uma2 family endonuclease [Myxococcus xanthus]QVW69280.1 Uma2 family endonuclease [Myxococcus xanthus DZ2]UEO04593.1 Uma2 family endonuclease [Myxococcus xanthus DZ2]UYI15196.1 Uma2 family endonuclease [Myxococcus xanthus]
MIQELSAITVREERDTGMGHETKRPATYEDLVALPEHQVGQIIDGELIAQPRPTSRHARATTRLGGELYGPFERGRGGPGGWYFLDEPELHFGADVLVPDLAGWRRDRMPEVPDTPYFTLSPDWVCEVLSPSTAAVDRSSKRRIYAREGVGHVWLVDPQARTLEVFRLSGGRWLELGTWSDDERVRAEPFEAVELELGVLWLPEANAK